MFKVPEQYRQGVKSPYISSSLYATTAADKNNGVFVVPYLNNKVQLFCIASDGMGWDHVSITVLNSKRCPSWEEMCYIKNMFWSEEDCVVQYHTSKENYVNVHPYCLHLWKPQGIEKFPQPLTFMVG